MHIAEHEVGVQVCQITAVRLVFIAQRLLVMYYMISHNLGLLVGIFGKAKKLHLDFVSHVFRKQCVSAVSIFLED